MPTFLEQDPCQTSFS